MTTKKVFVRDKVSLPPTRDQMDYLKKMRIQILETKGTKTESKIVIRISDSAYALCNPAKEEKYIKIFNSDLSVD